MKTEVIKGIKYTLELEGENEYLCEKCAFYTDNDCETITSCCEHHAKYGAYYIYTKPQTVNNCVWIVKEKKSGKHVEYCATRSLARFVRNHFKYTEGNETKMVIVKGSVVEV